MTIDTLIFLMAATLAFWFWSAGGIRAAVALAAARELCARAGVQLLDGSVVFIGLRPVRSRTGLNWRWRYRYEYSADGISRSHGTISVIGRHVDQATLPALPHQDSALH